MQTIRTKFSCLRKLCFGTGHCCSKC